MRYYAISRLLPQPPSVTIFFCSRPERRGLDKLVEKFERQHQQEAAKGADGVHGPAAADAGEELREAEVPQRPGQDGTGREIKSHGHASQNVVPEQKVSSRYPKI